jgi:hypothetical protein
MSRFHLSRLREAATRGDVDDERQVTIKRTRIARQMISPWTSRAPIKARDEERGARNRNKWERRDYEDWLYA